MNSETTLVPLEEIQQEIQRMALRLARYFATSPEFWIGLYDDMLWLLPRRNCPAKSLSNASPFLNDYQFAER